MELRGNHCLQEDNSPAAPAVPAGSHPIHLLHMLFSRVGSSRPAVMESVDEAEGRQGELKRKEQSLKASQKTAVLGWPPQWNGLIPGDSMYLFVFSQILVRQLTIALGCRDPSFRLCRLGRFPRSL